MIETAHFQNRAAPVRRNTMFRVVAGLAGGLVFLFAGHSVLAENAQRAESAPDVLKDVTVVEHLDVAVPADLEFTNTQGRRVRLGDYFDGERPVILTMNYSNCPKLCHLQLNGLFEGLEKLGWTMGDRYRMVTVSINPEEPYTRAADTKRKYIETYNRPDAEDGWAFLTGSEDNIRQLADTIGFGYAYDPVGKQYVHAAVIMVCTPDGRVSRYLYGVEYPAQDLRLALLEASDGKIGTTTDCILMFCFHYDASRGKYGLAAFRLMQVAGAFTVLVLGAFLGTYWLRERRKAARAEASTTDETKQSDPPAKSEEGAASSFDDR
ncbi:MAG: SCO family protein [Planctomycetota bacterium]|nr:MAG: SCO family protein [Planctomycetota bacterium]